MPMSPNNNTGACLPNKIQHNIETKRIASKRKLQPEPATRPKQEHLHQGQDQRSHTPNSAKATNVLARCPAAPALLHDEIRPSQCRLQRAADDGPVHVSRSCQESHRSQDPATARLHQGEPGEGVVHRRQRNQLHGNGQRDLHAGSALQVDEWLPFGHHTTAVSVPGDVRRGPLLPGISGHRPAQVLYAGRHVPGPADRRCPHRPAGGGARRRIRIRHTLLRGRHSHSAQRQLNVPAAARRLVMVKKAQRLVYSRSR